jgi:hypothetical protein
LLDVDDVDAIALCENKALHLWIPSTSLVSEVDSAVEELSHCYNCHDGILLLRFYLRMQIKTRSVYGQTICLARRTRNHRPQFLVDRGGYANRSW